MSADSVVVFTPGESDGGGPAATSGNASSAGSAAVTSIAITPLALVPAFSPDIQDYYVRCAAGNNRVSVSIEDGTGTSEQSYELVEDQALVVRNQYWIRCLPHDFPEITVSHPSGGTPTPGFYLVNTTAYGIVLDTRGSPVWYARGTSVDNVDALQANAISFMPAATAPYGTSPTANFEIHALDAQTTTYVAASGSATDLHELRLLPNGDHLLFSYVTTSGVDLTDLDAFGEDEAIADCEIQEVDPSGQLVWSWLASTHVDPVTESLEPQSNMVNGQSIVDVFHCNSIDVDASGNLMVSMRHTNAIFYIDRSTGNIVWKLGGTPTNKDGARLIQVVSDPEGAFNMQHDARFRPNGNISIFDDHGATSGVARGVEYAIDQEAGTATLVFQFLGTVQSKYEGSFRRYDDGESVIGWGGASPDTRVVTEVDANGQEVLDISFAPIAAPYRAVKVPVTMLDLGKMRPTAARW